MGFGQCGGEIAVLGHGKRHPSRAQDHAVQDRKRGERGRYRHRKSEPGSANNSRRFRKESIVPLLPFSNRRQHARRRQNVGRNRERNHPGQRSRITTLRILHFLSYGRNLFVSRIQPQPQCKTDSEYLKHRLVRRDEWQEWIAVPHSDAHDAHQENDGQNRKLQHSRNFSDQPNSPHVHVSNDNNHRQRNQIVLQGREPRDVVRDVVGEQDRIRAAEQKRSTPIPPSRKKSPEISKGFASPAVEAALDGHGGGEFGRDQRNRDAPEKRNEQLIQQRHTRARRTYLIFQAEGPGSVVGVHHEDEREETDFSYSTRRGGNISFSGIR